MESHLDTEHTHTIFRFVVFFGTVVTDIRSTVKDAARWIGRARILVEIDHVRVTMSSRSNRFVETL
jgi:hypothetical protein